MKTVWVLGAGASTSATGGLAPTLLQVPRFARDVGVAIVGSRTREGVYPELRDYVQKYFGVDLAKGPELNLEEVLTLLDIEIAIEGTDPHQAARNQLVRYLQDTFRRLDSKLQTPPVGEYVSLAESLEPEDTVITFNWDLMLDRALGRDFIFDTSAYGSKARQYHNFDGTFTAKAEGTWSGLSYPAPRHQWDGATGYYLKLHGSIDWVSCQRSGCRNAGELFILREYGTVPQCGYCLEPVSWLLVPPTLNKRLFDIPIIRRLWVYAAREISRAERLVIWGYSLPPTDFFSTWLLRRTSEKALRELVLIDPAVVTGKQKPRPYKSFLERFRGIAQERRPGRIRAFETFTRFQAHEDIGTLYQGAASRLQAYLGAL